MSVVYIVVVFLVTALLLFIPFFPFWKFLKRLKSHHPDIWNRKGPFDFFDLITTPGLLDNLMEALDEVARDETLKQGDPDLVKWCRMAQDIWRMAPRSFPAQIAYALVFFYFAGVLTSLLLKPFS